MGKYLFSTLLVSVLLSVPVLLSAGVCIPGLGCFSGVEGCEITTHEDLKINFKVDDLVLFNLPYLVSDDNSFVVITKLTVWYQF